MSSIVARCLDTLGSDESPNEDLETTPKIRPCSRSFTDPRQRRDMRIFVAGKLADARGASGVGFIVDLCAREEPSEFCLRGTGHERQDRAKRGKHVMLG
jgi:hypothetical protein